MMVRSTQHSIASYRIISIIWIAFFVAFHPASSLSTRPTVTCKARSTAASSSTTVAATTVDTPGNDNDAYTTTGHISSTSSSSSISRRAVFAGTIIGIAAATTTALNPQPVHAFANAMPESKKYADRAKRKGTPPKDLGVSSRTTEGIDFVSVTSPRLRTCDGNPNCFSTTGDALLEDRQQYGVDFLIAPWMPPTDEPQPIKTIAAIVKAYEPGQGGVDGGGFAVIKETDSYLYYQFEALKKGYIDDLEFAFVVTPKDSKGDDGGGGVFVRSASRVGVTDFGVNAVRLNYIASKLRSKGWSIAEITPETHRDYWTTANEAREATFDADRRNMD